VARPETFELLRKVPLFSRLGRPEIERLMAEAREIDAPDGQILARQGESGQEFFVVLAGNVIVAREEQQLARLGPGDFLGEIALLDGRPRTASATADGPTRLLVLDHRQFDALLDEFPSIARQVVHSLVERIRRTVTVPQFGIFAQGTIAHAFLEWDLRPDVDLRQVATVLGRLRGPTVSAGGVKLVLAFGSELWRARLQPPHQLKPVDLGHADVGDHQIRRLRSRAGQCLRAAGAAADVVGAGKGLQHREQIIQRQVLIFDHQNFRLFCHILTPPRHKMLPFSLSIWILDNRKRAIFLKRM